MFFSKASSRAFIFRSWSASCFLSSVFFFAQLLQPSCFLYVRAAILAPPPVVSLPADVAPAPDLIGRQPGGLRFSQYTNDIFGRVSRLLHDDFPSFCWKIVSLAMGPVYWDPTTKISDVPNKNAAHIVDSLPIWPTEFKMGHVKTSTLADFITECRD